MSNNKAKARGATSPDALYMLLLFLRRADLRVREVTTGSLSSRFLLAEDTLDLGSVHKSYHHAWIENRERKRRLWSKCRKKIVKYNVDL